MSQQNLIKQILVPQTFKHGIIESYYMSVISCLNAINLPHCHHNRRPLILGEKYFRKKKLLSVVCLMNISPFEMYVALRRA